MDALFGLGGMVGLYVWAWRRILHAAIARGKSRWLGHVLGFVLGGLPSVFFIAAFANTFPATGYERSTATGLAVLWIFSAISIAVMWHATRPLGTRGTSAPSPAGQSWSAQVAAWWKRASHVDVPGDVRKQAAARRSPVEAERRTLEDWGKAAPTGGTFTTIHATETWSREHPIEVSDEVEFRYRDSEGARSKRRVLVTEMADEYFVGFCLLRNATRTFRYDRVHGLVTHIDTGEMLSCEEWLEQAEALAR